MRFSVIIFTVLFGVLSFAPNMQGGQFFRLSEVIDHFQDHQNSKESFSSFLAFVQDHYFQNHKSNDDERHLPFKSSVVSALVLVAQEYKVSPVSLPVAYIERQENCFGEPHGAPQNQIYSIWNPPRTI